MSWATHVLFEESFSREAYQTFLGKAQNLFGQWELVEESTFDDDPRYLRIHSCWIRSGNPASPEWFRVGVDANRHLKDVVVWGFDHEWNLSVETGAGRSPLGMAVQLGIWLLAMRSFRFVIAVDRDSCMKNEPTEFRTLDAAREHVRRVLQERRSEWYAALNRPGIFDKEGNLILQQ